ncbi:hypothetical protein [Streptomyces phaeochromogenes]|uniref:hypothetical protein n=1 Tax=Streptomyces phaeochromogenes TaxID=1923 RepID=UPI00386AF3E8|nr:hypothetical protein OG277_38275 [Streptomyces phaeochromogenes]
MAAAENTGGSPDIGKILNQFGQYGVVGLAVILLIVGVIVPKYVMNNLTGLLRRAIWRPSKGARIFNGLAYSGETLTLVPARACRIDERIVRVLRELPAEFPELDQGHRVVARRTLAAVTATLGGSVPIQDIGALLRAMSPSIPAHSFASLVETTQEDVPEVTDKVRADDGSLPFNPDADAVTSFEA